MGRVPMIRVSSLMPVVRELEQRRVDGRFLLHEHLIAHEHLADPYSEVPLARYVAFLESAAERVGDPFFGAQVGTGFRLADLGPVGLLLGASATLRRGLEVLCRTLTTWQDGTSIGLHDEDGVLVWTYRIEDPLVWPRQQDSEYTLAATIAMARDAFGLSGRPLEAHLEHAAPEDAGPLARILGLRPAYGQPGNRLVFNLAEADRVHRTEDRALMTILSRHLDDLRQPEGEDGLLGRVRTLIGLHLGQRTITVPMIAAELRVSARTLQRRLADHGTSLRALVHQSRVELGRVHLRDGRASNAQIARALGYTDATAFWRAFKAGTGRAPSQYRRSGE